MAYYIRDDRETPGYRGHGTPILSPKLTHHIIDGEHVFIHAAPTIMHDACAAANIPGVDTSGDPDYTPDVFRRVHDARDEWAAQFGPGHALCWSPVYSTKPDAPECYFCSDPVVGHG